MSSYPIRVISIACIVFLTASLAGPPFSPFLSAETTASPSDVLLISDFETGTMKNAIGGDSGSWDIDPEDDTGFCDATIEEMPGPGGSQHALKLKYDVDSEEDPPQNGFWTKLKGLDASSYDHLEFDVKGDSQGPFTSVFRVEIKKYKDAERVEKLKGSGLEFVPVQVFGIETLYCEPAATNPHPNRLLTKLKFPLERSYTGIASPICFEQPINRYRLDKEHIFLLNKYLSGSNVAL